VDGASSFAALTTDLIIINKASSLPPRALSLVNEETESPVIKPSILFMVLFVPFFDDKNRAKLLCLAPTAPSTLSREFKSAFAQWHAFRSFTKMGRYFSFWHMMEAARLLM
jgi:hypothetical protein